MVSKDTGKSYKINKVVREFYKFCEGVKAVSIMSNIVNIQGFRGKPSNSQYAFLECLIMWLFYFSFWKQNDLYWVNTLKYPRWPQSGLDTFAIHCNKLSDIVLHKTIYCINDKKDKCCTHVSVQLQVHKPYNQNILE